MMSGGLGRYNLDVGGEMAAIGLMARIWEEDNRVLSSDYLIRKADLFFTYSSSFGPSTCAWREAQNRVVVYGRKWMEASWQERAEPHGGALGWKFSLTALWTFSWGTTWDWKGSTYMEAQCWAANWQLKVNRGHATGACWTPQAVHRERWLHHISLPQPGTNVDAIEAASMPESSWFFSWQYWTVCRGSRLGLPGRH
jgi:hypothetical protein